MAEKKESYSEEELNEMIVWFNNHADELPKEMILIVVRDEDKDDVVRVIMKNSRTGEKGTYGDGKVFVSKVDTAYTISTGKEEL